MNQRLDLRAAFRQGTLDKHAYSKAIVPLHTVLAEYATLLEDSDVDHLEIRADGVWLHSGLAPVSFALALGDRGTPTMVSLNFGRYERDEFDMWLRLVPKGSSIADIGANIGWYGIHWATLDPSCRVVAFEPVPDTYRTLQGNIARNKLANMIAEPMGVSSAAGTIEIFVDPTIAGAASAHPSVYGETSKAVTAPVVTLDSYARQHGLRFDALKIDVEGGELAVLQGAAEVLARDRPILFVEMLRRHAKEFGYHPNDIIALMKSHGYSCYRLADDALVDFPAMDDETVETNFFFIHDKKR